MAVPLAALSGGSGGLDFASEATADSDTITGPITLGGDFITGGGGGVSMGTVIVVGVVVVAVAFLVTR